MEKSNHEIGYWILISLMILIAFLHFFPYLYSMWTMTAPKTRSNGNRSIRALLSSCCGRVCIFAFLAFVPTLFFATFAYAFPAFLLFGEEYCDVSDTRSSSSDNSSNCRNAQDAGFYPIFFVFVPTGMTFIIDTIAYAITVPNATVVIEGETGYLAKSCRFFRKTMFPRYGFMLIYDSCVLYGGVLQLLMDGLDSDEDDFEAKTEYMHELSQAGHLAAALGVLLWCTANCSSFCRFGIPCTERTTTTNNKQDDDDDDELEENSILAEITVSSEAIEDQDIEGKLSAVMDAVMDENENVQSRGTRVGEGEDQKSLQSHRSRRSRRHPEYKEVDQMSVEDDQYTELGQMSGDHDDDDDQYTQGEYSRVSRHYRKETEEILRKVEMNASRSYDSREEEELVTDEFSDEEDNNVEVVLGGDFGDDPSVEDFSHFEVFVTNVSTDDQSDYDGDDDYHDDDDDDDYDDDEDDDEDEEDDEFTEYDELSNKQASNI